ncbi:MAG: hypothetical protein ACXW2Y_05860 [Acidimicrobiia bacterium]
MAIPVLLILAVLWAAVLIPPLFKARTERRRGDSIGDFTHKLDVIGRTGGYTAARPAPPAQMSIVGTTGAPRARVGAAPAGMTTAQRRRRDVLVGLLGAVAVTFVAALLTGSTMMWIVQFAMDALLVTYVVLLVRMRTLAMEQRVKVRYLPQPTPQLALRRTASS